MPTPTILIISSGFVAGIPHRAPDLTVVALGDELVLTPEPENPHDPGAIKILHGPSGQFLGYVPREQCAAVHTARSAGFEVTAKVVNYQPSVKWKELGYHATVTVLRS